MIDSIFPDMMGGSESSSLLASGGNPMKLLGSEKGHIARGGNLPAKASQDMVTKSAKEAGLVEAQVPLMRELSHYRLEQQRSALELLDIRVTHHDSSMKNEQAFQKKLARHGKNVSVHNMVTGATQANYNAYQQNYNASTESIMF